MKEHDNIDQLFNRLEGQFDLDEPAMGHHDRFLKRLEGKTAVVEAPKKQSGWWKPMMFAASVTLLLGFFLGQVLFNGPAELEEVSPQMAETQVYFTALINQEVAKLQLEENEDTKQIIEDAMTQLAKLEGDYESLKDQLLENGDDKRLIHAMIQNFQNRIDLLENVLLQIDEVKLLKRINDENNII